MIADAADSTKRPYALLAASIVLVALLAISDARPYDRATWLLEVLPDIIVLAISATYELIESGAALVLRQGADEFLGTQGDPWDTQSDMFLALIGTVSALLLLSRTHDRQLDRLPTPTQGALT